MKKRTIPIYTTIAFLLACNQPNNNTSIQSPIDTTAFKMPKPNAYNSLPAYESFLNGLDTLDVNTAAIAADKYKEIFQQEGVESRDSGYILFHNYYEKLDRNLNELHVKDTAYYMAFVPGYTSETKTQTTGKQKLYVESLHRNGFQLASAEGMTYVEPDLDVVAGWFNPYVSASLKEYIAQLNKENKEGFAADAGITISPEQYVDRVIWWENFIKNNPSFVLVNEAKEKKQYLFTVLLRGMENTPIRSYQDGSLETYYKTAYTYLQKTYPASGTNQLVAPYYKALQQRDKTKASALLKEYSSKGYILSFGE